MPLRPAAAFLSKETLKNNLRVIRQTIRSNSRLHHPRADILAIVKADAYGHTVEKIIPELEIQGIRRFAVASLAEALEVRKLTRTSSILVLGGTLHWSSESYELTQAHHLEVAVNDLSALEYFAKRPQAKIHLKLDTGMNRLGIKFADWDAALGILKKYQRSLEGLFTHFASSEERLYLTQAHQFEEAVRWFQSNGVHPKLIHSENSGALFGQYPRFRKGLLSEVGNLVRPGIAMYGYTPRGLTPISHLKPVLELVSSVELVKNAEAGEGISYGHLYRAKRRHPFGVATLGYADGLSKAYSRDLKPVWTSAAGVAKGRLSICGAICMDMVMLRSTRGKIEAGDRVKFWGRFPNEVLKAGIVEAYELNLRISKRIPRIWVK